MSCSTIYKIYNTKAKAYAEFRNGWGSGPVLWDYLAKVHLNSEHEFANGYKRVWELFYNPAVPLHHRIALAFTFDYALCEPSHLLDVADACEKIYPELNACKSNNANHWADFANALREIAEKKDNRLRGVALNCTSVSDTYSGEDVRKLKMHTIFPLETRAA